MNCVPVWSNKNLTETPPFSPPELQFFLAKEERNETSRSNSGGTVEFILKTEDPSPESKILNRFCKDNFVLEFLLDDAGFQ